MSAYSVVILTLNEERNLPRCLASVQNCDDLVVLDSGSTDRTVKIAQQAGARIFARSFDTFAGQRNHAQREISFRYNWVFHLDADEQFTPELDAECRTHSNRVDIDGFFVAPKMLWQGRWLRRCTDYPAWQARYVRAPQFQFVEVGHGQRETPGTRMARLNTSYLHDLSAGGEAEWLEKHRRYARAEAHHVVATPRPALSSLLTHDALARRRALKAFVPYLPARPAARFFYHYILRRGFLDGARAFHFCRLQARYERFMVDELQALLRQKFHSR